MVTEFLEGKYMYTNFIKICISATMLHMYTYMYTFVCAYTYTYLYENHCSSREKKNKNGEKQRFFLVIKFDLL